MRSWVGHRNRRAHTVEVKVFDATDLLGRPLVHIPHHSPGGFEWGYGGSGPADLALAILADYFRAHETVEPDRQLPHTTGALERAFALHQEFKSQVIRRQTGDSFKLNESEIDRWVALGYNQLTLARLEAEQQQEKERTMVKDDEE